MMKSLMIRLNPVKEVLRVEITIQHLLLVDAAFIIRKKSKPTVHPAKLYSA